MNPLLLQKQLKENATHLEEFTKDLKSWSEVMDSKENSSISDKEKFTQRKLKKSTKYCNTINPSSKIGFTDYAAWNKFDADAELEKLEDDFNNDSELTDECNENDYDQAIIEKEKGNKFVKLQKWDDAIKCYSRAIECYSYDPIFYANRALCYLKKEMYDIAENECNLSLKLDQTYVKALQRRAAARIEMKKYEHAEYDLLKVLEYEPKNIESKTQLEKLRAKNKKNAGQNSEQRPISKFTSSRNKPKIPLQANNNNISDGRDVLKPMTEIKENFIDESKSVLVWDKQEDMILVKPINKKPHSRSKSPLIRVGIKDNINANEKTETNDKIRQLQEDKISIMPWPRCNEHILPLNTDDLKVVEKKNLKDEKNNSNNNLIGKNCYKNVTQMWQKPTTSIQFYSTWNNLNSSKGRYKFLKSIDPKEFSKIFMDSLEPVIFSNILEVLAENSTENKGPVSCILQNLAKVKRFNTLTLFMTERDKKNIWILFDRIKETNELNNLDLDNLIKIYEL